MTSAWPSKPLAEVCEIKPPKSEAKRKLKVSDVVSFVPMEDLGIDQKFLEPKTERTLGQVAGSYTFFADGDVLLAKITPCFENGKLGIARGLTNGIGFGSSEYIVFRPAANLYNEYLYYFLLQDKFRADGIKTMSGAVGHKRVSKEFIERCQIPLPPLPEQQRIVVILETVLTGLATATANAEKNLNNARELFVSHLQCTFDAGHDQIPLHALATEITDGDHSPPPKAASGVPFITISNILKETGEIDFSDTFFVPREYFESLKPNKKPKVGDILYTVTGATLGIPALVNTQREFCFQRHIGLIRPKPDVDSRWLTYALAAPYVFAQATIGSTGAAQKTVSLKVLRNIEVPKVSLPEQQMVARKLDDLADRTRRLAAIYQQKIQSLGLLREVILQKAFSGELTSPSQSVKEAAE